MEALHRNRKLLLRHNRSMYLKQRLRLHLHLHPHRNRSMFRSLLPNPPRSSISNLFPRLLPHSSPWSMPTTPVGISS